jgi:hypothetical protein
MDAQIADADGKFSRQVRPFPTAEILLEHGHVPRKT